MTRDKTDKQMERELSQVNDSLNSVFGSLGGSLESCGEFKEAYLNRSYLNERTYESLYETVRIFQNIVNLIPEDSNLNYPYIKIKRNGDIDEKLSQDTATFLKNLSSVGEPLEPIDLKGALVLAGIYGRLYGDGFIFLGIDDGQYNEQTGQIDSSLPVDWSKVKSLDWVAVKHKYDVGVDYTSNCINYYRTDVQTLNSDKNLAPHQKFHVSRVIRFHGVARHGNSFLQEGFNMSVIDGVYNDFVRYMNAIRHSSEMLKTHSAFTFGIKGLASKAVNSNVVSALKIRFRNILEGIRLIGGVMYDRDNETAEYVNRSYSGVKDILEHLKDWLIGNSGMPRNKVFGSPATSSLSEASEGEAQQWNETIERYRTQQVIPAYSYLIKLYLAIQGIDDYDLDVEFDPYYQLTKLEEADQQLKIEQKNKTQMESYKIAIEAGIYSVEEVKALLSQED